MNKKIIAIAGSGIILAVSSILVLPVLAQTNAPANGGTADKTRPQGQPGVFGTVSAISGTTLTIVSKAMPQRNANGSGDTGDTAAAVAEIIYTVDASKATFSNNGEASTISAITAGDTVMVQGAINGTAVAAVSISKGMPKNRTDAKNDPPANGTTTTGQTPEQTKKTDGETESQPNSGETNQVQSEQQNDSQNNDKKNEQTASQNSETQTKKTGFWEGIVNFFKNIFKF
jgi:hypothetical protein